MAYDFDEWSYVGVSEFRLGVGKRINIIVYEQMSTVILLVQLSPLILILFVYLS